MIHRREFLHNAGAALALATMDAAALVAGGAQRTASPCKPIGWAKWSAEEPWFPVFGWCPCADPGADHACYRRTPYAVVACYADAA